MVKEFKKQYVFILFFSLFFSRIYIDLGFAFKPFMWVSVIGLILYREEVLLALKYRRLKFYEKSYLIFLALYSFTFFFASYPSLSIRFLSGLLLMLSVYEINRAIFSTKSKDEIIHQAILASLLGLLIGFLSYFIGAYKLDFYYHRDNIRINGLFLDRSNPRFIGFISQDPNITFMTLTVTFFLSLLSNNVYLKLFSIIVHMLAMLLTYSRAGILSLLFALFFYMLFIFSKLSQRQKIVVIVFLGVALIFLSSNSETAIRFINRFKHLKTDGGSGRSNLWKTGYSYYKDHILTGVGINNLKVYLTEALGRPANLHSAHLEVLYEGGIFTFIAYLFYYLTFVISFLKYRHYDANRTTFFMIIALAVQQSFLSTLLHESFFVGMALYSCFIDWRENKNEKGSNFDLSSRFRRS